MFFVWYFDFRVMSTLIGWLVTSLALLASVEAYFVTVDAHAEECFFDKVTTRIKNPINIPFPGKVWDKNGPHVWGGRRRLPRHWCQDSWTRWQNNPPGTHLPIFDNWIQEHWMYYAIVLPKTHPGRKGIQWEVYICGSHGWCLPVLLLQPDVDHDA